MFAGRKEDRDEVLIVSDVGKRLKGRTVKAPDLPPKRNVLRTAFFLVHADSAKFTR